MCSKSFIQSMYPVLTPFESQFLLTLICSVILGYDSDTKRINGASSKLPVTECSFQQHLTIGVAQRGPKETVPRGKVLWQGIVVNHEHDYWLENFEMTDD